MKVILFGASGMVGQGVLRECLLDPDVKVILSIGRSALPQDVLQNLAAVFQYDAKLLQLVHADLTEYSSIENELSGCDACFFCLGVSSAGMSEEAYRRVTYDITLRAAETLVRLNPAMTFIYVSGAGTDSTEKGRVMWARVKGATENALLRLPWIAPKGGVYMFRPGVIQPLHGIRSRRAAYRIGYAVAEPVMPWIRKVFPGAVTDTEQLGRAMLQVAKSGYAKPILEARDLCGF